MLWYGGRMGLLVIENGLQLISTIYMFNNVPTKQNINGWSDIYPLMDKPEMCIKVSNNYA